MSFVIPTKPQLRRSRPSSSDGDAWPRTKRVLPWGIAAFLVIVCLAPIDAITLEVSLPVDPKIDRIALAVVVVIWLLAIWTGGPIRPRIPRLGFLGIALWLWVLVAFLSVAASLPFLALTGELQISFKKIILLLAYVTFFLLVVSVVRSTEVYAFISLWIGLSAILAVGAIYTFVTGSDPFRSIASFIFVGPFHVSPYLPPTDGTRSVSGPTGHQLALTTMLVLPMPFILQRFFEAAVTPSKLRYGAVLLLCATGSVTTGRKSAIVVPVVIALVMFAYRPKKMLRLWPVLVIFIPLAQVVVPGALSTIVARADPNNKVVSQSTADRIDDWGTSVPDLVTHAVLGKGYGSNDPGTYRIVDDQWLSSGLETGALGVASLAGMLLAAFAFAHRLSRTSKSPRVRAQAVAAAAALPAFMVSMALYDALGYVEVFYLMFFIVGLTVVMRNAEPARSSGSEDADENPA